MHLRYRRALYLTFIIAFAVITPLLTLYTTGYRYNFKKNRIEKTGILVVESQPRGADIFINEKFKAKTPKRFSRLLPDTYNLRVNKVGHYSWKKSVRIESNLTTFVQNIVLFKEALPININGGEIKLLSVSPTREKILYTKTIKNNEELRLYNLKNGEDFLIDTFNRATGKLDFVDWGPQVRQAIVVYTIGNFNQYSIINTETLKRKELFDITRLNFDKVLWDETNTSRLYGLRQAVLYRIELTDSTSQAVISANIKDFRATGNNILYIEQLANEVFLNRAQLESGIVTATEKIKLPAPSQFTLQPSPAGLIMMLDQQSKDVFIISSNAFGSTDITDDILFQDKAKKVIWSQDQNKLLFYTDFEISTFDLPSREKTLVTRYGQVIATALWYPGNHYIIYVVEGTLRATEVVANDERNDTALGQFGTVQHFALDRSGEKIYFTGTLGNQQGLYQLPIQ